MIEDSKHYILELTTEELQAIKSALLFYSYEFINNNYTIENIIETKNISKKIIANLPIDIKSKNVYILKPSNTKDLLEYIQEFSINDEIDMLQEIKDTMALYPELLDHNYTI